ncbi:YpjP family protein [Bacillus sp. 1NLA3E]|uniref:YpjP family protein n=1 Tax=Bacillus sp. 1NLA3E TaxID=666686 RepID=UPI000247F3AC|nr:YpjP family protein [Bacillus sp. 1NLA3E]AGK54603.1 hypothetical protein B1NLA3E_14285 [Bacillus sp. 1NLA3E]
MPKWLKKSIVVLITVLTFGLVTPPQTLLFDKVAGDKTLERDTFKETTAEIPIEQTIVEREENLQTNKQKWVELLMQEAEEQSFVKFGQKIKPQIEDEFRGAILPKVEKAISLVADQYPEEDLAYLAITEEPGKGKSEKIFHIKDQKTGTDVIRFHVRRDHPPQQGFVFNFHYHTYHDKYQSHHDLGEIYWAKNTPPNWMS